MKASEFKSGSRVKIIKKDSYHYTSDAEAFPIEGVVVGVSHREEEHEDREELKGYLLDIERDDGAEGGGVGHSWTCVTEENGEPLVELIGEQVEVAHKPPTVYDFKPGQRVKLLYDGGFLGTVIGPDTYASYTYVEVKRDDGKEGGGRNKGWLCSPGGLELVDKPADSPSKPLTVDDFKPGQRVVISNRITGVGPVRGTVLGRSKQPSYLDVHRDDNGYGGGKDGSWLCLPRDLEPIDELDEKAEAIATLISGLHALKEARAAEEAPAAPVSAPTPAPEPVRKPVQNVEDDDPFSAFYAN